jgi:hypothetical protein
MMWLDLQLADIHISACNPYSERSQAEAQLRSQLEALSRKGDRLHDDAKSLTAAKCELEAEVGLHAVCFRFVRAT